MTGTHIPCGENGAQSPVRYCEESALELVACGFIGHQLTVRSVLLGTSGRLKQTTVELVLSGSSSDSLGGI